MSNDQHRGLRIQSLVVDRGGRRILDGVDLMAPRGQVTVLLGRNGAGKSTVVQAVLGLVPAVSGAVTLDGEPLARAAALRSRQVAWVPQTSRLDADLSVLEVVATARVGYGGPRREQHRHAQAALARIQAVDLCHRRYTTLSGGERQRVLIARALATGASCLVVDEPGAHLDLAFRLQLHALLRSLAAEGAAVLAVIHELGDALTLADRAAVLAQGRIISEGPPAGVLEPDLVGRVFGLTLIPGGAPAFAMSVP